MNKEHQLYQNGLILTTKTYSAFQLVTEINESQFALEALPTLEC